ncbi:MAG: FHA domain-containing protein [Thiothrix sp.]|nr:MAG: FHA domain-containing protein [Thiothrix sp.]
MANLDSLLLEIQLRPLNQYYSLTKLPLRIGRALDNDIILSDPTVSAYHLEIEQAEQGLRLRNLSKENGTRVNGKALQEANVLLDEPVNLRIGSRRARLLDRHMVVARASVRQCTGCLRVFCNPFCAFGLMIGTTLAFIYEAYLQSIFNKEIVYYFSSVMPYLLGMIALTLVIAGISRLSTQRWDIIPPLSLAALFMLIPHLLGELGHALNYLFTANWPLETLLLLSNFLLMPLLLYAYIRLVHQSERWPALGIALLFSAPLLVYQAIDLTDQWTVKHEFTGEADFNRNLSAWDLRLKPTLTIDDYFNKTEQELGTSTTQP